MKQKLSIAAVILAAAILVPQIVWAAVGSFSSNTSTPAVSAVNTANGRAVSAASVRGVGGYFVSSATSGNVQGVYAQSNSATPGASGVYGYATNSGSGATNGVFGRSNASAGRGVNALAAKTGTLVTNYGVYGQANGAGTNASGVKGFATAATGLTNGVWGSAISDEGVGVYGESPNFFGMFGQGGIAGVEAFGGVVGIEGASPGVADGTYGVVSDTDLGIIGHVVGRVNEVIGTCTILASAASSANCTFATPFEGGKPQPEIFVTPLGDPGGYVWVSAVTTDGNSDWNGFTVTRSATPATPVTIQWFAVGRDVLLDTAAPVRAGAPTARTFATRKAMRFER